MQYADFCKIKRKTPRLKNKPRRVTLLPLPPTSRQEGRSKQGNRISIHCDESTLHPRPMSPLPHNHTIATSSPGLALPSHAGSHRSSDSYHHPCSLQRPYRIAQEGRQGEYKRRRQGIVGVEEAERRSAAKVAFMTARFRLL